MEAIIMPQIGQDLTTGVVLEWFKNEGDPVEKGEIVANVESEKATFDVEAEASGVLLKIVVQAGEEGEVFGPIGYIGSPDESFDDEKSNGKGGKGGKKTEKAAPAQKSGDTAPGKTSSKEAEVPADSHAPAASQAPAKFFASPSARRVARELGVALEGIKGSGPKGRIVKKDVLEQSFKNKPEAAVGAAPKAPTGPVPVEASLEDKRVPFNRIGKIAAEKLTQSKQHIPHFYLYRDIDMEDAMEWRSAYNRAHNTKITVTDMIVYAASQTLAEFPVFNSHVDADAVYYKKDINIGVATSTDQGLVVPVIPRANELSVSEISKKIKQNAEDAKKGKISLDVKGTFSVTTLGMFGIPAFLPIINPPECAILSIGAVEKRVVPVGDYYIGVRKTVTLALASDHRAVGGVEAAKFLQRLDEIIISLFGVA